MISCGLYGSHTSIHANIPQFDFSTSTAADKLTLSAALQVNIGNPLLMLLPHFDHGTRRLLALIVNSHSSVTKTSNKHITLDLVRGQ